MEKIAVIDLGSSKVDLVLAKYLPSGHYTIYEEMSEPVKIVDDFDGESMLKISKSNEVVEVLKMYKMVCEANGITNVVTVGSNSLKNLKNYKSFIDEIYNSCGIKIRILTQEEELNAIYVGVINALDISKGLIVSVTGGAIRIVEYNRRNTSNSAVIPFGTYSLAKNFEGAENTEKALTKIISIVKEEIDKIDWLKNLEPEYQLIGLGSSFIGAGNLSRKITKYPFDNSLGYVLTKESLNSAFDLVKGLEIDKTKRIKGVSNDRADVFSAGLSVIKAIFDTLDYTSATLSTKGMIEGLIYNAIAPSLQERPLSDLLQYSLENISYFYDNDYNNSNQVNYIAQILFRQLKVLHKLPRTYVKVLRIACAMHDCGHRIKYYDHEKNSFFIILNSEIFGATHREIVLSAFVSASQNINDFSVAEWIKYKDILFEEDLDAIKKLSVILKLAEALDKTHRSVVQDVGCDILGDSVIMKTICTMDGSIETREALKVSQDFKKVYSKTLEVL